MYNRYIPPTDSFRPIWGENSSKQQNPGQNAHRPPPPSSPIGTIPSEGLFGKLGGLFKRLHLEDLDSGDVLLILILVILFLDGDDNLELVIMLGLLLLFSLFGSDGEDHSPSTV